MSWGGLEKTDEYKALPEAEKEKIKRIPLDVQISEYDALKEQADSVPMNTFIKKALNSYTGQEIFKV